MLGNQHRVDLELVRQDEPEPVAFPAASPVAPTTAPAAMTPNAAFPPLQEVSRPTVDTAAAAYYLNRKVQTLRIWACYETGPLRPLRVHGRLAWPVDAIRQVLQHPKP